MHHFIKIVLLTLTLMSLEYCPVLADLSINISINDQRLYLINDEGDILKSYPISSSRYGTGNQARSYKTPLGKHWIHSKIGDKAVLGQVFKYGKAINRIIPYLKDGSEDLITTRILRLEGLENGINKGPNIDSFARAIYIHGTPYEDQIGSKASKGCIRLKNKDMIELYDLVSSKTIVRISID